MIYTGKKLTTPGTAVALGGQVRASWVVIQWPAGATGNLYIGGPTSTAPFSANCPAITAGNSVTLPAMGVTLPYSLDKILIDSDNAGTAVFLYGKA